MCVFVCLCLCLVFYFFFNDTATTEIYTLSLHDALPIWGRRGRAPALPSAPRSAATCQTASWITRRRSGPAGRSAGRDRLALVLSLEPLDAAGGVHELLLARVERVALRADFHPHVGLRRASLDDLAALARDP